MKNWTFLLFLLIGNFPLNAQQILWEKKLGWNTFDQLNDGIQISEKSVIAVGNTEVFGTTIGGGVYFGLMALKINIETGDTVWLKNLNQFCNSPKCVFGDNNLIYVLASESLAPRRLLLSMVDTNGNLFFRKTLDSIGEAPRIEKLIRTNDGNFLVTGTRRGVGTTLTNDMFALKFDAFGTVLWNNRYNANPNSGGNHVEETPEGHYLLSGNAGSKIWRVEVDSDGNQISSNFLYQTPSFVNFDQNTSVLSTPDSANSISGSLTGGVYNYYFGKHKQVGNSKIWGGEQQGYMAKPLVNIDGSIVQYRANNIIFHLNRLRSDSSLIWSLDLTNRFSSSSTILNSFIYLPDSSAIAIGYLFYLTSQANDFYFCRISNVGVPYDPSIIISTKSKIKSENLVPYPNPVTSSLVFKGLKEEGFLYLYDLKGQIIKELPIKPYQRVYLNEMPKGLYLYRIQTSDGGFYSGKFVRQ